MPIDRRDLLLCGALLATPAARAQRGPVRTIAPFLPGGSAELIARPVCEALAGLWRRPVLLEHRPGPLAAAEQVVRAAPDGATLGWLDSAHLIIPALRRDPPYDPRRGFAPVCHVAQAAVVLAASPALPVTTMEDMLDFSRDRPEGLSVATPGVGTVMHLIIELLAGISGASLIHAPHPGGVAAAEAAILGHVPLVLDTWAGLREHCEMGRLQPIAACSAAAAPGLEHLPLIAADFPGFDVDSTIGLVAPRGTPPATVAALAEGVRTVLATPSMRARLALLGCFLVAEGPDDFGAFIARETERWARVVRSIGLQPS